MQQDISTQVPVQDTHSVIQELSSINPTDMTGLYFDLEDEVDGWQHGRINFSPCNSTDSPGEAALAPYIV